MTPEQISAEREVYEQGQVASLEEVLVEAAKIFGTLIRSQRLSKALGLVGKFQGEIYGSIFRSQRDEFEEGFAVTLRRIEGMEP